MIALFAHAGYWIALFHKADALHARAVAVTAQFGRRPIVTTQMVLTEFLNWFAEAGQYRRSQAIRFIEALQTRTSVRVIPQTPDLFADAFSLYKQRPDKEWSLTDCASILICQREGITEVLAND